MISRTISRVCKPPRRLLSAIKRRHGKLAGAQDFVFNYITYMYLPYDLPCTRSSRVEIPHFLFLGMITYTFRFPD